MGPGILPFIFVMKPATDMSRAELIEQEKKLTAAVGALSGLMLLLVVACGYITYRQGFNTFAVLPLVFLPMVGGLATARQKIKKELSARPR